MRSRGKERWEWRRRWHRPSKEEKKVKENQNNKKIVKETKLNNMISLIARIRRTRTWRRARTRTKPRTRIWVKSRWWWADPQQRAGALLGTGRTSGENGRFQIYSGGMRFTTQCKDKWTCTLSGWKKKVHVEEHSFFLRKLDPWPHQTALFFYLILRTLLHKKNKKPNM